MRSHADPLITKPIHEREKLCRQGSLFGNIQVSDNIPINTLMIGCYQECFVHEAARVSDRFNVTFETIGNNEYHSAQCLNWKSSNGDSDCKENQ